MKTKDLKHIRKVLKDIMALPNFAYLNISGIALSKAVKIVDKELNKPKVNTNIQAMKGRRILKGNI